MPLRRPVILAAYDAPPWRELYLDLEFIERNVATFDISFPTVTQSALWWFQRLSRAHTRLARIALHGRRLKEMRHAPSGTQDEAKRLLLATEVALARLHLILSAQG